jgi:hypothetical protein
VAAAETAARQTPGTPSDLRDITCEMHFRMHDVATSADTGDMDLGRATFSTLANDGYLSLAAAVVVLLVLVWALASPFWQIPDEPPAPVRHASLPADARVLNGYPGHAGPADATSPIPRATVRYATPRHAAGPGRPVNVSGSPPWGPAPRPPGLPPTGWLSGLIARPGA